jgi:hypothetical protein
MYVGRSRRFFLETRKASATSTSLFSQSTAPDQISIMTSGTAAGAVKPKATLLPSRQIELIGSAPGDSHDVQSSSAKQMLTNRTNTRLQPLSANDLEDDVLRKGEKNVMIYC